MLREPFNKPLDVVDWLTWTQVEELYLKPQRADNDAMRTESGGGGKSSGVPEVPDTFEEFILHCRNHGYTGEAEDLRAAYETGKAAKK